MKPWVPSLPSFVLLLAWGLWCALHSFLISPGFTRVSRRVLGPRFRFYRFAYVLFSLITLAPLLYLSDQADQTVLWAWEGSARLIPILAICIAASLFIAGARHYDVLELLGFRQMREEASPGRFQASGILGAIRHPWYAACFPLIWARDLTVLSLRINMLLSTYLIIGTLLEERKLVAEFGESYREYQRRVSMFFPWRWLMTRLWPRRP